MVDRPPYPIPENVNPGEYRCIVVPVPDDPTYIRVFAGVISDMTQWFNWARDEGKNGKECAQVWRDIYNEIDWSGKMGKCGCCPPPERKYRWTDDGHYQISDDGGVTWTDDSIADPRYSVPEFPPNPPEGAILDQCTYADSVVNIYKNQFVEAIEVGDDIQTIIGIIIGIISAVLGTVAAPLVYQIMAVVVGAILAYTIEAFQAAFTTDVWDRLRCNLLENMGTDGSFTQEQVDSIYARIGEEETGIVDFVLKHAVATFGAKGLTNAARSGFGSLEATCEECAPDPIVWFVKSDNSIVEVFPDEEGWFNVDTGASTAYPGLYYGTVYFQNPASPVWPTANCLRVTDWDPLTGTTTEEGVLKCSDGSYETYPFTSFCYGAYQRLDNEPWTARFKVLSPCP